MARRRSLFPQLDLAASGGVCLSCSELGISGPSALFRSCFACHLRSLPLGENREEHKIETFAREKDELFMQQALAEAGRAFDEGEVPVGAVVVFQDRIVGRGHNQVERLGDPTAHAEMIALTAAAEQFESWRLLGAHLYVTVEPCAMCAGAAMLARVERIVFGVFDPKFGACGSVFNIPAEKRLNHQIDVTAGILADQTGALMVSFFRARRQKGESATNE